MSKTILGPRVALALVIATPSCNRALDTLSGDREWQEPGSRQTSPANSATDLARRVATVQIDPQEELKAEMLRNVPSLPGSVDDDRECEYLEHWKKWNKMPDDLWRRQMQIRCEQEKSRYVITSAGPDRIFGTGDDLEMLVGTYQPTGPAPRRPSDADKAQPLGLLPPLPCPADKQSTCAALEAWKRDNELPDDIFGTRLRIRCEKDKWIYIVTTAGPDRRFGTKDDDDVQYPPCLRRRKGPGGDSLAGPGP